MAVVTVTVTTQPTTTPTATSSDASSTVSAGTLAGIVIGVLVGGGLLITLLLFLLTRYNRPGFTRVANHARDRVPAAGGAPDLQYHPSSGSRISKYLTRHSQRPSLSNEPLISPASWPPLPSTSRVHSLGTPRSDTLSPGVSIRDSQFSSFDRGDISHVVASGSVSQLGAPAILNIPPARRGPGMSESPRTGSGSTTPRALQPSGGVFSPPTSPKPQQTLFLHRMLQSRARASEGATPSHRPSVDFSTSRSATLESPSALSEVERLLAEAERTALRDAEEAEKEEEENQGEGEGEDWGDVESAESIYSEQSAPLDHTMFLSDTLPRRESTLSVARRKSSRRRARTPGPTELPPVAEVPDTPSQRGSRPVSTAANSSVDGQASHGTASRPMPSAVDPAAPMPLLTSANFGKDSTTSGTPPGSISSAAGWGSQSSGSASRYPSLAPSSILGSSQSGSRSEGGTDWHHPPRGLAGLKTLPAGPLRNPHSPVEEQPEPPEPLHFAGRAAETGPGKRARLREGTTGSVPEVERRTVVQGGVARIDIVL